MIFLPQTAIEKVTHIDTHDRKSKSWPQSGRKRVRVISSATAIVRSSSEPAFKVVNWYLENIFKWTARSSSRSRCGTRTRVEWEFQNRYVGDPFRDDHHYCEESAAGWFMIQALDTVRMLRIWNWLRFGMFLKQFVAHVWRVYYCAKIAIIIFWMKTNRVLIGAIFLASMFLLPPNY